MAFKHAEFNRTEQMREKGFFTGLITGINDAITLRNRYQTEIDNAFAAVVNMVHYVEDKNAELKATFNSAKGLRRNIDAHETERAALYDTLGNLLKKETDFEEKMWRTTQKGRKVKSITVKQKFKDSDIDEMRYDTMMDYLKQYPEYASKSSFKKILDKIEEKEREIRKEKQEYNSAVSQYNYQLSLFEKDIKKAEDKISAYHKILEEGQKKLSECRFRTGKFYKLASEKTKAQVNLDTLHHRVEQFTNTLNIFKSEHAQNKRKEFVEMEY